ncbi:MaoC family dehydratase [uncultured Ferrovibrio sp.]|jgi:3-hydroxybutyryl-CoA dehydratase|uniref:MaoC family dehydratase n=1 Tax=uncultured Ferrovibrio sp. TaxID=1576913 RepID=UPI0026282262|nr:MaoC family dehydratase [uncultured Ferrovibrio sp.]
MTYQAMHGYYLEDLSVGMSEVYSKTVAESDIVAFAELSGDTNPVHLDEDFAAKSPFKGRIAHGMLGASLLSTVFGTKLPGPGCIYVSQDLRFKAPVRIGDTVVAKVTILEINQEKRRVKFACECRVGDTVVIDGEAVLMVSRKVK